MSFVESLNRLMKENDTSNLSLSRVVGVSDTAVGKWRKGEAVPSLDNAVSIAEYFRVSLDELVGNELKYDLNRRINLPVIGTVSVWGIYINQLWAIDYIPIRENDLNGYPQEECFALRVKDSSLGGDLIEGISYIIFHQQKQCANNDSVIIRLENSQELLYKRFVWEADRILLYANNVQTLSCRKQDVNKVHVEAVQIGTFDDV